MPFSQPLPTITSLYNNAVVILAVNSTTIERVIAAPIVIGANTLGLNDSLLFTVNYRYIVSGLSAPVFRIRLGGLTGTQLFIDTASATENVLGKVLFQNRNAANVNFNSTSAIYDTGAASTLDIAQLSVDTTQSLAVVMTASFSTADSLSTIKINSINIQSIRA